MVSNNLLSDYQFGFVKGRSTTLQLLNVLNDLTNSLENKFTTDCIYLDYQKAFDSVPHKRLISKLQSYKFNPVIISWIENYLQDRSLDKFITICFSYSLIDQTLLNISNDGVYNICIIK